MVNSTPLDTKEVPNSITPTVQFSPQKYRGHTITILGVLNGDGGLSTRQISDKTGIPVKVVYVYCSRGVEQGIIYKQESWGFAITPLGIKVLSIAPSSYSQNTKVTQNQHKHNTITIEESRTLNLTSFSKRDDLTEFDKQVVVMLSDHYCRTDIKYRLFGDYHEVFETFKIPESELQQTLRHLKEEGCIYVLKTPMGWKIGLMKGFIARLKEA